MFARLLAAALIVGLPNLCSAQIRIAVIGDSNIAGKSVTGEGVPLSDAYPAKLEKGLRAKGYNVVVTNEGVAGDTSVGLLNKLDRVVPQGTQLAIVGTGGNDMVYSHTDRATVVANLRRIIQQLTARGVVVAIFTLNDAPKADAKYHKLPGEDQSLQAAGATILRPFQTAEMAADPKLHIERTHVGNKWHLTAEGYEMVAQRTLPTISGLVAKLRP